MFDYDYYVGMSLLSTKGYSSAKESLYSYIDKDLKYQMFRKNDKAAYVNLARLTYEDLSKAEADSLLKMVVATIPDNGTAMIQCALHYLDMNMPEKGYMHLRRCVDNPNISDLGPIVMLIASLADQIRKYPAIWEDVRESVYSLNNLDINSYLAFVGADSEFDLESLNDLITIKNATSRRLLGFKRCLSDKFDIVFDKKCSVNKDVLSVYRESYGEDYIKVCQNSQDYTSGTYSRKYLMTKFPDFNSEPHLLYNFFTSLSDGEVFVVKNNLAKGKDISHYEGMELFDKKQKRLLKRLINRNKSAGYALSSSPVRDSAIVDRFKLDSLYTKSYWKQWNYIPVYGSFVNLYRIFNRSLKVIDGLSTEQYESNHRIHFVGNNLFYTPSAYWEQEKECIRIFFDGLVSSLLTFVYNPDTERVELFSFLSQGNLIYLYPEDKMSPISPSKDEPDCKSDSTLDEDEGCKSVETKRWWHRLKFRRKD